MVIAVAGGGNALITDLLAVPGASRTVLEIVVPYAESAMAEFVGRPVDELGSIVSADHAASMADAARERAQRLAGDLDDDVLHGLAITATLVTDRVKRGEHRAHIALAGPNGTTAIRIDLEKGATDRAGEDRIVADRALVFVAEQLELPIDPSAASEDRPASDQR